MSVPNNSAPLILVVDDDPGRREIVSDHLKDSGFFAIDACDAPEAIEVLEMDVQVDLVFADIQMPGAVDGFGLAKWVSENRPAIPVFLASAVRSHNGPPGCEKRQL